MTDSVRGVSPSGTDPAWVKKRLSPWCEAPLMKADSSQLANNFRCWLFSGLSPMKKQSITECAVSASLSHEQSKLGSKRRPVHKDKGGIQNYLALARGSTPSHRFQIQEARELKCTSCTTRGMTTE